MKISCICKWYHYINQLDKQYTIALECIDNINNNTFWKIYTGKTIADVNKKAKCFETRFFNKVNKSL